MVVPHPMPDNVTGLVDFTVWANTVTNNFYGNTAMWFFFVVYFISFKQTDSKKAFAGASFLTAIIGILMFQWQLVSIKSVTIAIILTGLSVVWLVWDAVT